MNKLTLHKQIPFCALLMFGLLFWVCPVGAADVPSQEKVQQTAPAAQELDQLQHRVRELLASDSLRDQTWGAYYVAHYRLKPIASELIPVLTRALESQHREVVDACIDGLMQTGQAVDNDLLDRLWLAGSHHKVLYLASNNLAHAAPVLAAKLSAMLEEKENSEDSISLITSEEKKITFIAVCNMLMRGDKQTFVKTIRPYIRPTLFVRIELPPNSKRPPENDLKFEGYSEWQMADFSCGRVLCDTALPPSIDYSLSLSPMPSDTVFAQGPQQVYIRRDIDKNGANVFNSGPLNRLHYCRDSLIWLNNPSDLQRVEAEQRLPQLTAYKTLHWTSKEDFLSEIQTAAAAIRDPWLEIYTRFQTSEGLPDDAGAVEFFPIHIEYHGHIETIEVPLPTVFNNGELHRDNLQR